jgi:hypothetical protein
LLAAGQLRDDQLVAALDVNLDFEPPNYTHAGLLMRQWFEEGWRIAGGRLRLALDDHPLPDLEVTDDLHAAHLHRHFPPVGLPFLLLAARLEERGEQNWNRLYNRTAWLDFLSLADIAPHMAAMVAGGMVVDDDPMVPAGWPGRLRFHAAAWLYTTPLRLTLEMHADTEFLSGRAVDDFVTKFTAQAKTRPHP